MKHCSTWLFSLLLVAGTTSASEVEVLHFWTSAGEAKALNEIQQSIQAKGHSWKDFAVAGGGGENARAVLAQRVATGVPPVSSQMKGTEIPRWAERDLLANLDDLAAEGKWDQFIPKSIAEAMKYDGHYVAVPVNIHRINWMWVNLDVLEAAGVSAIPSSIPTLIEALEKIKAAGYIGLAHGSQPWQDTLLFESVLLSKGGVDFYRRAFLDGDQRALTSNEMLEILDTFRSLKAFTDFRSPGRDWNLATSLVIRGKAGIQIMGDWAKGEFAAAQKTAGADYDCYPTPGTENLFSYTVDSFAMFKVKDRAQQKAQDDFANSLLAKPVQENFNILKGSIPVRKGISDEQFDECGKKAMKDFAEAEFRSGQLPSMAQHMVLPLEKLSNVYEVISEFWNDDTLTALDARNQLAKAME